MEVILKGEPKEIAALVVALQERQEIDEHEKSELPKYVVAYRNGRAVIEKRKRNKKK